eukprot:TRINITY_DN16535_c0_g1_i4.p1 TRINITY_DN16535_c0_g1~~TRINITY_DN16535_c0_g1_i4.p1  ORF type:complete len:201 (-),score=22.54 TRINITY_DN16535_c0_g1_i4:11-613(-)
MQTIKELSEIPNEKIFSGDGRMNRRLTVSIDLDRDEGEKQVEETSNSSCFQVVRAEQQLNSEQIEAKKRIEKSADRLNQTHQIFVGRSFDRLHDMNKEVQNKLTQLSTDVDKSMKDSNLICIEKLLGPDYLDLSEKVHQLASDYVEISLANRQLDNLKFLLPLMDSQSKQYKDVEECTDCLLYTSPSPRDRQKSRMPSSA